MTTFTMDDLPGITFTVERGTGGNAELPSNWIHITGTTADGKVVCSIGFAGP